jgi:hypothetical protein
VPIAGGTLWRRTEERGRNRRIVIRIRKGTGWNNPPPATRRKVILVVIGPHDRREPLLIDPRRR